MMYLFHWAICCLEYLIAYEFTDNFLRLKDNECIKKLGCILIFSVILFFCNLFNFIWLNPIVFGLTLFAANSIFFIGTFSTKFALAAFLSVLSAATEFLSAFVLSLVLQSRVLYVLSFAHNKMIAMAISVFTLWAIVKSIKFVYSKSKYNISKLKANALFILPLSSIIIMHVLLYFNKWIPPTSLNVFLICSICILLGLVNLIVFNVYNDQMKAAELRAQLLNARLAQEKTEEYYHAQEQHLQDMHTITHDFKKHLTTIRAMADTDKPLNDYLDQLSGRMAESSKGVIAYTENKVINVILHQKQEICLENDIELIIKCEYPLLGFIKYPDACSIFGNALDNAIAACFMQIETHRYITLNVYSHNETLVVEFENSRNPLIKLLEEGKSIFKTTKKDPQLHGYGLINIKDAVKSYGGCAIFNFTEDTFNVSLFIPLNQEKQE